MELEALTHISSSTSSSSQASALRRSGRSATVAGAVSQVYHQLRHWVFTLFAAVNSCPASSTSPVTAVALLSIEGLQCIWFAISPDQRFPWHPEYISWLLQLVKIVRFDSYVNDGVTTGHLEAIIIIFVMCLLVLAMGCYLVYQLERLKRLSSTSTSRSGMLHQSGSSGGAAGNGLPGLGTAVFNLPQRGGQGQKNHSSDMVQEFARQSTLLAVFTLALKLSSTVLFMPTVVILITPLRWYTSSSALLLKHSDSTLNTDLKIGLGLCALLVFLTMCGSFIVFKWPRNLVIPALCDGAATGSRQASLQALEGITRKADGQCDALERPHSRCLLLQQILRLGLTVAYTITTSHSTQSQWALCLFFVSTCVINVMCCMWYMPFRAFAIVRLQLSVHGANLWSAIGLALTLLYNNDQQAVGAMILFFGAPLVVQVLFLLAHSRRAAVLLQPCDGEGAPTDPYLAELQLRLRLEEVLSTCQDGAAGSSMELASGLTDKFANSADGMVSRWFAHSSLMTLYWPAIAFTASQMSRNKPSLAPTTPRARYPATCRKVDN